MSDPSSAELRRAGRLLIVGGDGLLGSALNRYWRAQGCEVLITSRKTEPVEGALPLDLSKPPVIWPQLPECRAAVLCAAVTSLDQCRRDPEGTRQINVKHTLELARRLADRCDLVVFISSNLVFDGSKPLRRTDEPTSPRTEYGRQKADVEKALVPLRDRVAIVRLTKVIHPDWPLARGWMQSFRDGKEVTAFHDMGCAPIELAATTSAIAAIAGQRRSGIWHLSAGSDISYAEVARQIAEKMKVDPGLIKSTSARALAGLEHVPDYTSLDATRSAQELGFEIPDPAASIARTFFS